MTTYTKDQILAIGGNTWENPRNGETRIYVNDWAGLVGLEINRYKSGNICSASLNGQRVSNGKAGRMLVAKLWWSSIDNTLHLQDYGMLYQIIGRAEFWAAINAAIAERHVAPEPTAHDDATTEETPADAIIEIPSRRPGRDPRYSYTCPKCGKTGIDVAYRVDAEKAFAEHLTTCAGTDTTADDQPQSTPEAPADPAMLITALRSAGRTVREIAAAVGVHTSTVYRWARGLFRPTAPRLTILASI